MRVPKAPTFFVCAILALGVAACGSSKKSSTTGSSTSSSANSKVSSDVKGGIAVLLPDTQSSPRWETQDRKYLDQAFTAAGVKHTIVNAQGDPATQRSQADQALTNGAKVILLVDLDPGSGAAIINAAHARGAKVIDYDRLTLGGGADYYVSFNNETVGKLQGQGLVNCMKQRGLTKPVVAELNGSPTDNNATLFANGYNSVLDPLYKSGTFVKGPNQSVPEWDAQKALTIFEQMLQQTNNKINAVLTANDTLATSVISALGARKLGKLPTTGQDATTEGIQHILAGQQCMTVYKPIKKEADAASKLAIELAKGQTPTANQSSANKGKQTPSVLLVPISVTKSNLKDTVFKDGFVTPAQICQGTYKQYCTQLGIQ